MKNTKVTLVPLASDDREQFILDNQWAFKYGALQEFGKSDDHINFEGEIREFCNGLQLGLQELLLPCCLVVRLMA